MYKIKCLEGRKTNMLSCSNVVEESRELTEEIIARWRSVLLAGDFILGQEVSRFESWVSNRCSGAYALTTNSGTDSLTLGLLALGIAPGDEVITCANSFVATVAAIVGVGATPILADVGLDELLSVGSIEPLLTERTRGVIVVHLRGRPVDIRSVTGFCESRNLFVVEDCAQAIGTTVCGRQVGTFGDVGAFSLHPLKSLGGVGDGGVVVTRRREIAEFAREARNHGLRSRGESSFFGRNSRLDTIQAAALNVKTKYLDQWLGRRREIAIHYNEALSKTLAGQELGGSKIGNSYYHYVIRTKRRNELRWWLMEHGIEASIHYPTPVHLQDAWLRKYGPVRLPVTEQLASEILSIPCHHSLTDLDVERIASTIAAFG
jgi:dTDP-3-amino-2,3,6-trideoxy-4-keto-D-glucose/dTDP-3-amino-3,4,6-trideoxy-alpha-D-glucose/dTDP-2,6-dideoxy-D-kanosamine transaminase